MKRSILVLILIITALNYSFAQSETTEFDVNGIKVIFKPTVKNIVSARVYFRGGVTNYSAKQAGIERLSVSAALACGTTKHIANEFKDAVDYYNMSITSSTGYDESNVQLSCIATYFDKGWSLLAEAVNNPVFDKDELQLEKSKVISDIKQGESSPDKYLDELTMRNAFDGTPYATDPDGTVENINAFTADELKAYYKTLLNKNKMFIVIAGKITKQEVIDKVTAAFANIPAEAYTPVALNVPIWRDNKVLSEPRTLSTNYMDAIINAPDMTNPDFVPFKIAISVLSGDLFHELRTKRNLSYAPGAHTVDLRMPYAEMYISTTKPADAADIMMDQLRYLTDATISSHGMDEIRSSYITSNYMKLQSSSAITGNLGEAEILGGWHYFEDMPAVIEQLTAAQITKALKKYALGVRWSYLGDPNAAATARDAFSKPLK